VREPTTDDCKPQGTKKTLDPDPRENEPSRWEEIHWKEGIKASPIIQHEEQQKAKYFEGLDEILNMDTQLVHLSHAPDGIAHGRDPLSNDQ
jgi:hypothetical protein